MTHPQDDEINEPDKAEAARPCDCDEGGAGCVDNAMIMAVSILREHAKLANDWSPLRDAINCLDNAGVFNAIDEETDWDTQAVTEAEISAAGRGLFDSRFLEKYAETTDVPFTKSFDQLMAEADGSQGFTKLKTVAKTFVQGKDASEWGDLTGYAEPGA